MQPPFIEIACPVIQQLSAPRGPAGALMVSAHLLAASAFTRVTTTCAPAAVSRSTQTSPVPDPAAEMLNRQNPLVLRYTRMMLIESLKPVARQQPRPRLGARRGIGGSTRIGWNR
jgi:hypothetical protein